MLSGGGAALSGAAGGMWIKFCGLARPEDARHAARLGVDAVGLVFYPPSPRAVTLPLAREIVAELPDSVTRVGLFVHPRPAQVEEVLAALPLDLLQFHGRETPEACRRYGLPYLKAVHCAPGADLERAATTFSDAFGILLDSFRPGAWGGTGQAFDWSRIPRLRGARIVLAGGLRPDNVAQAIRQVSPDGVDVSSGIESAPGVKSSERMSAFVEEVRGAEHEVGFS